jgi:CBS domain-containing protein
MTRPSTGATDGLTVADVMHADVPTLSPAATVGDARAWFQAGASRRLALIADAGRYAGALTPADVGAGVPDDRLAVDVARPGPTVAPEATAPAGRDAVLRAGARRVPVVDGDGRLVGVLAVTADEQHFACR